MESKTYYLRLKTVSPIHIGCDQVYEPTGFALDEEKMELISFEPAAFLGKLEQKDLDSYSAICKKGTVPSLLEIYKFIRQHKEHVDGRRVAVSDGFLNHYNKTLKITSGNVQNELNNFKIDRTAFQPLNDAPYIPGSAIKGAIRTAILNLRSKGKNHLKFRNGKQLNDELSGGTFEYDPFRLIKVSDFRAMGDVSQRIVYGVNRKKKKSEKEARGPYQILEVVEEGSEFVGTVTVQKPSPGAGIKQAVTFAEIQKALAGFYNREQQSERIHLQNIGCDGLNVDDASSDTSLLRIGRHSGAECVTVENYRDIKIMQGPGVRPKYKEHATTIWLAAGTDNPATNKFLRPFGWVVLSLLSEEEIRKFEKNRSVSFKGWETDQQDVINALEKKTKLLADKRKIEEQEKKRLAEEQKKREEELREFPWREYLSKLEQISDWGALRTQVLEQEDYRQYQAEEEVGHAVMEVAVRVAEKNLKKWDESRDQLIAEWLAPSAVNWTSRNSSVMAAAGNPLLVQIRNFKTPADYDRTIDFANLDIESCRILSPLFKKWGWDKKKKAKANNHQLWKALQGRLRQIKG